MDQSKVHLETLKAKRANTPCRVQPVVRDGVRHGRVAPLVSAEFPLLVIETLHPLFVL